ncbi:MAG TPA: protein DA1 [Verrucomicrobiae bacterium]|nr:protein DA1 [Verrucomicrobiae bacterium]
MKVLVTAVLLMISAAAVFCASPKCRVCDQAIWGEFYRAKDKARGGQFEVCTNCIDLQTRCFSCSLPVKTNYTTLADGRLLCTYCAKDAITEDEEARKVCWEARDELDRLLVRFLAFPRTNLSVTFVDSFTLDTLFKSPGYTQQCTSVFGATRTMVVGGRRFIHAISILNGLSRPQLEAVAAHEFAHAWLNENLSKERWATLSKDAVEGFCELIAYELMQEHNYQAQKTNLKESPYTAGQLDAFLAAQSLHGFNAVLDWVKAGESKKLDAADPDGIRATRQSPPTATRAARPAYYSYGPTSAPPSTLTLKNISGGPSRRLAIINDRTLTVGEQARLTLATSNVVVRCLEIRSNSVLVQLEGAGVKQELFLPER